MHFEKEALKARENVNTTIHQILYPSDVIRYVTRYGNFLFFFINAARITR